jgi:hypothetical protein
VCTSLLATYSRTDLSSSPSSAPLTLDEITSALHLSNMWGFKIARERAISAALSLIPDPRERIVWAYKYDIQGWTIPALQELILRREPMSIADLELLGPDMTLCISSIREMMAAVHSDTSLRFRESAGDRVNLAQIIQQECNLLECDRPILQSWPELEEWVADPDPVAITWVEFVPVSSIVLLPGLVATIFFFMTRPLLRC